ncbi:MAG: hypothetical protein ABIO63_02185 [Casimicrobiaceae bacterium]
MYTFIMIPLEKGRQWFEADIALEDPEHIADRLAYYDGIAPLTQEEACIALIAEE